MARDQPLSRDESASPDDTFSGGETPSKAESFDWLEGFGFRDPERARSEIEATWRLASHSAVRDALKRGLQRERDEWVEPDRVVRDLARFLSACEDPSAMLGRLADDPASLRILLTLLNAGASIAGRLIADPEAFEVLAKGDFEPVPATSLADRLRATVCGLEQKAHAAAEFRQFYYREALRIACGEFIDGVTPEKVGRQLATLADVVIDEALNDMLSRHASRRGLPQRPDGTTPEITVLGLGSLGGQEMSYAAPLKVLFVYDSIDRQNAWHRQFYEGLVDEFASMLNRDFSRWPALFLDLREGPRYEVGVNICSYREFIRIYETAGRIWQRLNFVKARVVAGSKPLGNALLGRLQPWIYRNFMSRVDLDEIRTLRHKLERRAERSSAGEDVLRSPGGRSDLEWTVSFLQLLHGGNLPDVRCGNTYEAIAALQRNDCLTHQEATLLSQHYARLCRLEHQLSAMSENALTLPADPQTRSALAWRLGLRSDQPRTGDLAKFEELLADTFEKNRRMINHLMVDTSDDSGTVAIETELLLDPDPDPELVESTMRSHGLPNAQRAMEDLAALSTETVSFLSPHRCRHFFSAVAPSLLTQVARTPDPEATLKSLVEVTDSLGAKATLWELLANSQPTMELMVRLCATTPYLTGILVNNPGMIDELIDSLIMNRLPSAQRLDAHSIELCRGAADIETILHSFKNSAHLTIGVRDMLGKETLEATHQAIGDTAEACLRRMIDAVHEELASHFGDPVDNQGEPSEFVTLALGKLGGREPNYHSDLDVVFLYTSEGETRRRIGGHRATLTNEVFFNRLSQYVVTFVNDGGEAGRLYELDSRLRDSGEEGVWAMTVDAFLDRFRRDQAPLWQRLALCKGRAISGPRHQRQRIDEAVREVITSTRWEPAMATEVREMRDRMQRTAHPNNLKRGEGGTVDVELAAQMLTLQHAAQHPEIIRGGTTASIDALANAGLVSESQAVDLVSGYRSLRRIEGNLRLMNTKERHELPEDPHQLRNLAFLMNEADPDLIVSQCQVARNRIRRAFEQLVDQAGK